MSGTPTTAKMTAATSTPLIEAAPIAAEVEDGTAEATKLFAEPEADEAEVADDGAAVESTVVIKELKLELVASETTEELGSTVLLLKIALLDATDEGLIEEAELADAAFEAAPEAAGELCPDDATGALEG